MMISMARSTSLGANRAQHAAVLVVLSATAMLACCAPALAQDTYPSRPVKIIAPQAPGGGVDLVARIIADRLRVAMGQPFVVENQAGAGGAIADADDRARAAGRLHADDRLRRHARHQSGGETQSRLRRRQGFHADRHARRHAQRAGGGARGAGRTRCRNSSPTPRPIRARSTTAPRASARSTTCVMEQFKHASGVPSMAVPYRSIGQAFTDAMGGQIQVIFPGLAAAMPHVRSGAFKPLAVTGDKRQPLLPDVPTFKESGYEGFDGLTWYGIVGPANLPEPITRKLNEEINKMLASPDLRDTFAARGAHRDADDAVAIRQVHRRRDRALDGRRARQQDRSRVSSTGDDDASGTLRLGAARGGVRRACRATLPAAVTRDVRRGADGRRRPLRGRAQQRLRASGAARDRRTRRVHADRPRRRLQRRHRGAVQRHRRARRGLRRHVRRRPGARRRGHRSGAARHRRAARPRGPRRRARHRRRLRSHVPPVPRRAQARAQGRISSHGGVRRARRGGRRALGAALDDSAVGQRARHRRQHGVGHHRIPCRRRLDQAHAPGMGGAGGLSRGAHGAGGLHRPAHAVRRRARLLSRLRQQRRLRLHRDARRRGRRMALRRHRLQAVRLRHHGASVHRLRAQARRRRRCGPATSSRSSARRPRASCTGCGSRSPPSSIRPTATPPSSAFPTRSRSACCAATPGSSTTRKRWCTIPRCARSPRKVRYVVDPDNPYPRQFTGHVRVTLAIRRSARSEPGPFSRRARRADVGRGARGEVHRQLHLRRLGRRSARAARLPRCVRCAPRRRSISTALRG